MNLYKSVISQLDGTEDILTGDVCSKISMMSGEVSENVYLLILCHYSDETNKDSLLEGELPYASKTVSKNGRGVIFKLHNLPEDLQKIIYRYVKIVSSCV